VSRVVENPWMDYSLTWDQALSVVLAAVGMYLALLLALRLAGRRLVAPLSTYDVAAGISVGAVFGRAVLGYTPTLPAGVIGVATLALLHKGTRSMHGARGAGALGSWSDVEAMVLERCGTISVLPRGRVLDDALTDVAGV
jgi:uncharacterized membrane protein YcaP (DUF421 family)